MIDKLKKLGNIPITVDILKTVISDYNAFSNKLARMVEEEKLIHLKKDLYLVSPQITGLKFSEGLIANHIYAPSYVSLLTALRIYGIIPERVETIQSMTLKKSWETRNETGCYTYTKCKKDYFNIGITYKNEAGVSYMIASPEKALSDLVAYTTGVNIRFLKTAGKYLTEDMRMEVEDLRNMDIAILKQCMQYSKKKESLFNIIKFIEKL